MTARLPDREPLPRLWISFAAAWLLVLVLVAWYLPKAGLTKAHLGWSIACAALLGVAYLWLTVCHAPSVAELAAEPHRAAPAAGTVGAIGLMAACVFEFTLLAPGLEVWWLMMFPIVAAGLALTPALAGVAMVALIAIGFLAAWLSDGRLDAMFLLEMTFGASAIVFRHLMATAVQLRRAREELARAAVSEERLRFARDLHDLLGRSLSTIVLKSELAGRLASREPDRAAGEIGDVERTARDALWLVRAAVAGYRRPSLASELSAARELLAAAGIEERIESSPAALPPAADGLLGWAVREGVTNVVRHSRARSCTIRLGRRADLATAEILDDGSGKSEGPGAIGCGLAGLIERAAAEGGHVDAGPMPGGGFRLVIAVPLGGRASAQR